MREKGKSKMGYQTFEEHQEYRLTLIEGAMDDMIRRTATVSDPYIQAMMSVIKKGGEIFRELIDSPPDNAEDLAVTSVKKYIEKCRMTMIHDMSFAINALKELMIESEEENHKYIIAYREFLQSVENCFANSQRKQGNIDHLKSIFTVSYDVTKGKPRMFTLYSEPFEYQRKKILVIDGDCKETGNEKNSIPVLCSVLMPSDQDAWDVCRYLPMLTHEASHNFRYVPSRADRNKSAVQFIIERFCRLVLRDLFSMIPESGYSICYARDLRSFSKALTEHMYEKFCKNKSDIIENGRLDHLSSAIYSYFIQDTALNPDVKMAFSTTSSPRDIICESVRDLLQVSGIFFSVEYGPFCKKTGDVINDIMCHKEHPVRVDEIKRAINELTGIILDRFRSEVLRHYKQTTQESDNRRTYAYWNEIIGAAAISREKLDAVICKYEDDNGDDLPFFEYVTDILYRINTNICNIYYLCRIYHREIPGNEKQDWFGKEVYGILTKVVSETMTTDGYSADRIRMTSEKMHSILIKLGLFNGDMQPDVFLSYFDELFHNWESGFVIGVLEEIIKVYREIFADLGMCAAFGFTEDGYKYYMEKNAILRPEGIAREIMLDRIDTVCRILRSDNTSEGDDDKYYKDVYEEYMTKEKSLWVKQTQMMEIVSDIRAYYNNRFDDVHERKRIGDEFASYYNMKYEERKNLYNKQQNADSIRFLTEDVDE